MNPLILSGGRVIDPASSTDETVDLLIEDGRVTEMGRGLSRAGAEVFDVSGAVVAPGLVDMHVHLREPGREDEETIATGSAAAVLGGFTAVCAMPNTDPVCDGASVAEMVFAAGRSSGLCEVIPAGSITKGLEGKHLSPIGELVHCGVKLFTDDGKGVQDSRLLRRAMEYIRGFDAVCAEHCEDASLAEGGQMHEGEFSEVLGLKGIPSAAEEVALARDIVLAELTGVRFHALHISTAGSAEMIKRAKASGLRVTAEVTPHHLVLTDSDLVTYDTNFKVNPPLRSTSDVESLREALAQGAIDAIASDHAPHSEEEKESEFEIAPPGMLGLETALSVMLSELVSGGVLSLMELIRLMSTGPARILGLEGQGGPILQGSLANLVVFDPSTAWTVEADSLASISRNTPWGGRSLTGKVVHTISGGRMVVRDGALASGVLV